MTVITGFQCTDGIMMCADTEQGTSESTKSQTRKIDLLPLTCGFLLIGGAGDGGLIDYTVHSLLDHLLNPPCDLKNIEGTLNAFARQTFHLHIRPYAKFPAAFIPDVQFLVGVQTEKQCRLFKWDRNFAYAVPARRHTSIGIGTIQADPMLNAQQFYVPADQMLFYAVRLMQKVKQLVQGCGGKTEITLLKIDGTALTYATNTISAIEELAEEVDEFFLQHLLTLVSNVWLDPNATDDHFKPYIEDIKRFRKQYLELRPFNYLPITGTLGSNQKPQQSAATGKVESL